ncbi:MAG TPA: GAF domain-containing protein [Anaerolineales bacterium]|nr:GAF domain-containing protein [Anaerolineales bacterium]
MFTAISRFFESSEDKDASFIDLVRNILIFTIVATILSVIMIATLSKSSQPVVTVIALTIAGILEFLAFIAVLRGKILMAKVIVPPALIITITIIALSANSIHDISIAAYPLIIIIGTLLQGRRSIFVTTPLAVAAIALLGILDMLGLSNNRFASSTGIDDIIIGIVLLTTASGLLNLLITRLNQAIKRAEANENAQSDANSELRKLQASLEHKVEERTKELTQRGNELEQINSQIGRRAGQFQAITQVTQAITSIRELPNLLPHVASVISEKFGFYHVGVFLLDEVNEYAILSATNSEGGQKMLERNHRLRVGEQGIVGNVTRTGIPRVAMDVGVDAVYFNNPELPHTHSEMALPLKSGDQIIGALDVQSTERAAFTDEDIQMLSLLANQVSLAIENARLFEETRKALSESEAVGRQATREIWRSLPVDQNLLGYRYTVTGTAPLEKPIDLTGHTNGKEKATPRETNRIVVPIELRGEIIGNLVVQSPSTGEMNSDQVDLIKAVAERVAISAENARLFDETTRRAERERKVSDITSKIRSVNDPQAMIQTAIEELRNALGASRVDVVPQTIKGAE